MTEAAEEPPSPTEEEPEAAPANSVGLGEVLTMPNAEITVVSFEQVDSIELEYSDPLVPADGESLWLMELNFVNTSNKAIDMQCLGPDSTSIQAWDTESREMLEDSSGFEIKAIDCHQSVLSGQSGSMLVAYRGLADSKAGGLTVADFGDFGNPGFVVFEPGFTPPSL